MNKQININNYKYNVKIIINKKGNLMLLKLIKIKVINLFLLREELKLIII